jgi:hypothetical protein
LASGFLLDAFSSLIDRQYLARPYYGSRGMAAWLATGDRGGDGRKLAGPVFEIRQAVA